jgi:HK97 family phage prohead protease
MTAAGLDLNRRVAEHEAAHCAAAIVLGFDPERAVVHLNNPDATGHVDVPLGETDRNRWRDAAKFVLAARCFDPGEMPDWPPQKSSGSHDERILAAIVDGMGWTEADWRDACTETWELVADREFDRLHKAYTQLLEDGHDLTRHTIQHVKAIAGKEPMQHLTLKAVTTPQTDEGVFTAVISTASVDREGDVVEPSAMAEALRAWTFTGKMVPLHWNHSSDPADIVGHVNPATVEARDGEVHATGWVDQSTERGQHVWRLAKSGTLGFSFGYLIPDGGAVKRADGVREIHKLDVFEVSATPAPMNNDTGVLSTKAVEDDEDSDRTPTHAALERRLTEAGIITSPASAGQYQRADVDNVFTGTSTNGNHRETKSVDQIRTEWRDTMLELLTPSTGAYPAATEEAATEPETKALPPKPTQPIKVASFEC